MTAVGGESAGARTALVVEMIPYSAGLCPSNKINYHLNPH